MFARHDWDPCENYLQPSIVSGWRDSCVELDIYFHVNPASASQIGEIESLSIQTKKIDVETSSLLQIHSACEPVYPVRP